MSWTLAHRTTCIAFVLASAAMWWVAASDNGTRGVRYIAVHLALSALMFAGWVAAGRTQHSTFWWTVCAGALARLVIAGVSSFTSNDVSRYLWDGHLLLSGADPWLLSPGQVHAADWPRPPDNLGVPTLYPPGAVLVFAFSASFGPSLAPWVWKGIVVTASLLALATAAAAMRGTRTETQLPLIALSPLLVLESGVGAHLDILVALACLAAVLLFERERWATAGAVIGIGALLKFLPLVLLVPITFARGRRVAARTLSVAAIIIGGAYGLTLMAGLKPFGSLGLFFARWRFASPVFGLFEGAFGAGLASLAALVIGVVAITTSVRLARQSNFKASATVALVAPILASPVCFPWYLASAATVGSLAPSTFLLLWAAVAPVSYEVIDRFHLEGVWSPARWVPPAIAIALLLGAAVDVAAARRKRGRVTPVGEPTTTV